MVVSIQCLANSYLFSPPPLSAAKLSVRSHCRRSNAASRRPQRFSHRQCCFKFRFHILRSRMAEIKAAIGLSWEPKLPAFSSASKKGGGSGSKPRPEANPLWKPSTQLVDGLFVPPNDPVKRNKLAKKQIKDTAGTSWFDMPAPTMTPELQKDLQLLKLRNVMDPKRHYKKGDAQPNKYFQVGTVIESPLDFFSGRLTKKERKVSLAEEVLSDRNLGNFRKRKVREIEEKNRPGGNDKWKIKGKGSFLRAKQRRH